MRDTHHPTRLNWILTLLLQARAPSWERCWLHAGAGSACFKTSVGDGRDGGDRRTGEVFLGDPGYEAAAERLLLDSSHCGWLVGTFCTQVLMRFEQGQTCRRTRTGGTSCMNGKTTADTNLTPDTRRILASRGPSHRSWGFKIPTETLKSTAGAERNGISERRLILQIREGGRIT